MHSPSPPALVWLRNDLRTSDHPALAAAAAVSGRPVACVYVWSPEEEGDWPHGAATRWWLHHSLTVLAADLATLGSPLIIRRGPAADALEAVAAATGAESLYFHRRVEPAARAQEEFIEARWRDRGGDVQAFWGNLLTDPREALTAEGRPYQVFTPFWKSAQRRIADGQPLPKPTRLIVPERSASSLPIAALDLLPRIPWDAGFQAHWSPGETGAHRRLDTFLKDALANYATGRDQPAIVGSSRLSPHLHFGEISPREIWHRVLTSPAANTPDAATFLNELGWREFAHSVLYHFPHTAAAPLRTKFVNFPWRSDFAQLHAWQRGRTGYPIVDAGMRELWATGTMHNRVRMIVGSFLTKDLLQSWRTGAEWFWDTLVDADLANNTLNWQWVAGCGADAAPFFRIFNPVAQGQKFDPQGTYVRRWVPELAALPDRWIHHPWEAPLQVLDDARVRLGRDYPQPIVNHATARIAALASYRALK